MPPERKSFLLRLDPRLYDALQRYARDELRSVNAQIEFLLRQSLAKAGRGTLAEENGEETREEATNTAPESDPPMPPA